MKRDFALEDAHGGAEALAQDSECDAAVEKKTHFNANKVWHSAAPG
jgi:hypothetical protein